MSDQILVTGTLDFNPDNHDTVVAALIGLMETTRAEEGNIGYTFSADLLDRGRFHVVEQWESQDAMDSHMGSAHMAEFMVAAPDLGIVGVNVTAWYGGSPSKLM